MTPEQWEKVDRVWHAVLARPEHERDAALTELCAGDVELRREVESLLANLVRASSVGFGAPLTEPEPARLTAGTRLGPYEIIAAIGAGGMGEVYRARDTRLGRDVAVKVLPFDAAHDPDRLRRFTEEARAAAALNHPNILAVYDVGSQPLARPGSNGDVVEIAFIVTELLEGRTLRQLLGDEALTPARAIGLASQVADGLSAAHARGIVHRDLKPENLFVTADAHAKILDFGLAKAMAEAPGATEARTKTGTAPHVVLGTPGYMAPEQLRGQAIDHRADVFAFGAVLYEMLTGRRAFGGDTPIDAMGAVLRETPSVAVSTPERPIPTALVRIVERCLEKTPAARFQSTNDLAFALKSLTMADAPTPTPEPRSADARRAWVGWLPWAAAVLLAIALVAVWQPWRPAAVEPDQLVQFEIPETADVGFGPTMASPTPAISPDGSQIVFMGGEPGGTLRLWIRSMDSLVARPLRDTEASAPQALPFWSWDGRFVAFNTPGDLKDGQSRGGRLKAVDVATGRVRTICEIDSPLFLGGSWGPDDTIVFATRPTLELQRVSASGGTPVAASKVDPSHDEGHHRFPSFLPDGRHFVFQTSSRISEAGMMAIGSLDNLEHTLLVPTDSRIIFAQPGYMLYLREGALVAHPFDVTTRRLTGDPVRLVDSIRRHQGSGRAAFTASRTGTLVYRIDDDEVGKTPVVWVNRKDGSVEQTSIEPGPWVGFELFDLGRRVLTHLHTEDSTAGLWVLDLQNTDKKQVMTGATGHDSHHHISPDGVQFAWIREGFNAVFRRRVDGVGEEERFDIRQAKLTALDDYSKNWLIATATPEGTGGPAAIWYAEAATPQNMKPYFTSAFAQGGARLSPDEKWLAFYSSDPGMPGIHIRPFPNAKDGLWVVQGSRVAGALRWRSDGKELFFMSPPGVDGQQRIVSIPVTVTGNALDLGAPETHKLPSVNANRGFDVSPDGQRFLLSLLRVATSIAPTTGAGADRSFGTLNVVLNWPLLLQRR